MRSRGIKGFLLLAAFVALPLLLGAACGDDDDATDSTTPTTAASSSVTPPSGAPIKIACICDQSGPLASNGQSVAEGAKLAVGRVNAAGGVLGRPLELIVYDDKTEPARATSLFLRATETDGVVAVVMGGSSAVALAVLPDAKKAGVPLVLANQQAVGLTNPVDDFAFRVTMSAKRWAEELVPFIKSQGWTKVGVFYRDDAFGQSGNTNVQAALAATTGLTFVGAEALQPDGTDFTAQAQRLRSRGADVLVSFAFPNESLIFLQNKQTIGWTNVAVIGNQGWGVPEVIRSPILDGAFFPDLIDVSRSDVKVQLAEYQKAFNRDGANAYNVQGFDGVGLIAKAIAAAGSAKSTDIAVALRTLRYDTLEGSPGSYIQYSNTHHDGPLNETQGTPVVFYRVSGGKAEAFKWTRKP